MLFGTSRVLLNTVTLIYLQNQNIKYKNCSRVKETYHQLQQQLCCNNHLQNSHTNPLSCLFRSCIQTAHQLLQAHTYILLHTYRKLLEGHKKTTEMLRIQYKYMYIYIPLLIQLFLLRRPVTKYTSRYSWCGFTFLVYVDFYTASKYLVHD